MNTITGISVWAALFLLLPLAGNGQDTRKLREVVVTAQPPGIRAEGSKLILNTSNMLSSGISATELLKTMPGISIGQDDEILFRGSPGVQVMINGKMTYMTGKELAKMLNGLNAADISKIELQASPSAEFDASGTAGIINIVTKKQKESGYALELRSALSKGKYWMVNDNITGSFKNDRLNIDASFDYNTPHLFTRSSSSHTIYDRSNKIALERENEVSFKVKFYTYKIGAAWQLHPRHQLTAGYSGYTDDFSAPKSSHICMHDRSGKPVAAIHSRVNIVEPYYFDAFNAGYQFDLDSLGRKLTADVHLISYRNYSNSRMESHRYDEHNQEEKYDVLLSDQPGFIRVYAYKVDALLPYSWLTLKAGLKYSLATNDNRARFDSLLNGQYVEAGSLSNHFDYREEISAAYVTVSKAVRKTVFNAGLRLEHTQAASQWGALKADSQWRYTRLFPSVSVNMEIDDDNRLDVAFSHRIQRPPYSALNPVRWYNDPYYLFAGNSSLQPETSWLSAITYTWKRRYILMLNYSSRSNYLSRNITKDTVTQALINQRANFDHFKRFDANIAADLTVASWWKMRWNAGISFSAYPVEQGSPERKLSQWAGAAQCVNEVKVPGDINMELAAYWYSGELSGIFRKSSYFYLNAGVGRAFLRKRMTARISVSDVFFTNHFRAYSLAAVTDYRYFDRPDTRRVTCTLTYSLGGKLQPLKEKGPEERDRL